MNRLCWIWTAALLATATQVHAEVTVEKTDSGATIKLDGQPFAEYLAKSGNKPVIWPVVGPGGKRVTRGFPLEPLPGDTNDHVHQRGIWLTYDEVNGNHFWKQEGTDDEIKHREFKELKSGDVGKIVAVNDWVNGDGKVECTEERVIEFAGDKDARWIDFDITLTAPNGDVHFGDTKEGSFGIRVADSIRVDSKKGGKIVNSKGQTDQSAWGQACEWVDYYGPVDGETVGVAIMNHPSSFAFPTRWHVRTYGLFAANPFGKKAFDPSLDNNGYTLPKGKSINLKYRMVLHRGDEKEGKIAERWKEYSGGK